MNDNNESHAYAGLTKMDTSNATYIPYWKIGEEEHRLDGTSKRGWYEHLEYQNQGLLNGHRSNDEYITYLDNRQLGQILTLQLDIHPCRRGRVIGRFCNLPLEKMGARKEWVLFVVSSYVVHNDQRSDRRCHPNCHVRDEVFLRVQGSIGLSNRDFRRLYGQYEQKYATVELEPRPIHDKYGMSDRNTGIWPTWIAPDDRDYWLGG